MIHKKLFIIHYDTTNLDNDENTSVCHGIYTDLETAKNKLKNIYNDTPIYKFFCYKIKIFELVDKEYKFTNNFYTYMFDKFTEYTYED